MQGRVARLVHELTAVVFKTLNRSQSSIHISNSSAQVELQNREYVENKVCLMVSKTFNVVNHSTLRVALYDVLVM